MLRAVTRQRFVTARTQRRFAHGAITDGPASVRSALQLAEIHGTHRPGSGGAGRRGRRRHAGAPLHDLLVRPCHLLHDLLMAGLLLRIAGISIRVVQPYQAQILRADHFLRRPRRNAQDSPSVLRWPGHAGLTPLSATSRSATKSASSSIPTDRRMRLSRMPRRWRSA